MTSRHTEVDTTSLILTTLTVRQITLVAQGRGADRHLLARRRGIPRRSRREGSSFMNEMKELMSSMIGEQIRAALPATAVTRSVIPTTASVVFGYGDGTQTSATIGDAPMTVASHAHGTMLPM